ncbi:MAG TPA: hypothetical protein VH186_08405 [Chloroflexia bacterium]|nr:hypothetical protein [Chloroflexia bacterium]
MAQTTKVYGLSELRRETFPLAAWIWGHRLRGGQHWIEYMLEFLNVLVGFDYQLGQGLDKNGKYEYRRFTRLGLRRFVFYDEREKSRHPLDDEARAKMIEELQKEIQNKSTSSVKETLNLIRNVLRSFSAIEEERSWFAKSLFPAHENLLFWEGLRPRASKYVPGQFDEDISFNARNFFARGGEVYYLILSAGTEKELSRRLSITSRLENLLKNQNSGIGRLAEIVNNAWSVSADNSNEEKGSLGWIPDPDCQLYQYIAEDVAILLSNNLDVLECFDLLAHLICFHLVEYIYHRAHFNSTSPIHQNEECIEKCRPTILIDALEESASIIRDTSATLFRQQEYNQEQKIREYVPQQLNDWAANILPTQNLASYLKNEAEDHFSTVKITTTDKVNYPKLEKLTNDFDVGMITQSDFIREYAALLISKMFEDFRKNFLSVHRKLAKTIGLVAPRSGPGARFILDDTLLKALVLSNIEPGNEMVFDEFLERIYHRYGIIIGSNEAKISGHPALQRINSEFLDRNRFTFLEKMHKAGLVNQYSDATAMVINNLTASQPMGASN